MKHIISLIVAIIFFAGAVSGYAYLLYAVGGSMNAVATARAESDAAEETEKFARNAQTFLSGLTAEQAELETYAANDSDFVAVIETIEAAALREGVKATIGSVNVTPGDTQFHETVTVTASARGSFKNVTSFIAALETLPLASRVAAVSLEVALDNAWFGTVTLEVIKRKP